MTDSEETEGNGGMLLTIISFPVGAITMNVAKLEEAGLVSIKSAAAKRGAEGYTQLRRSDPVK